MIKRPYGPPTPVWLRFDLRCARSWVPRSYHNVPRSSERVGCHQRTEPTLKGVSARSARARRGPGRASSSRHGRVRVAPLHPARCQHGARDVATSSARLWTETVHETRPPAGAPARRGRAGARPHRECFDDACTYCTQGDSYVLREVGTRETVPVGQQHPALSVTQSHVRRNGLTKIREAEGKYWGLKHITLLPAPHSQPG